MKKISMIVPCYNEEENISLFYKAVKDTYKKQNYELELIFINDGSSDKTLPELKKLIKNSFCKIKVISLSRNFGKESVIYAGLKEATGDYTLIIDADMQQNPKLTIKMAEILDENPDYDCVCYYQEKRIENKLISSLKNLFYKTMNKMTNVSMKQGASDFRMFRKNIKDSLISMEEYCRFTKGMFAWIGYNTKYLPYTPLERANGKTKWKTTKLMQYGISGIISFSNAPLKLATVLGFCFSFFSIIYLFIVLIKKIFFEISIPGYPTIVSCILLIGGIQLFCLGIIGEYIGKVYLESKHRPKYIIKEKMENSNND
ncbi:MAG: glycosyltransferase family 2 protein [bacterium]|nr:glycosyltransferase family 2 protein [bacterium]